MTEELTRFISNARYLCEEELRWGTMLIKMTHYLGSDIPPLKYISSVRAIVFKEKSLLVVTDHNGDMYILPGGRVKKRELPLETLKREILEETGYTLRGLEILGFVHFHHLGNRPENYEYPYPDFIWPVYVAEAGDFIADAIQPDDYVSEFRFQIAEEVRNLPINKGQLLLLEEAIKVRGYN